MDPLIAVLASGMCAAQTAWSFPFDPGALVPLLLTMAGPALHFYVPRHRKLVDKMVSERRMTEEEVRRQMCFVRLCAPTLSGLGLVLLLLHFGGILK